MSVLIAGNTVLDIHLDVDGDAASFAEGWADQNVSFLDRPPSLVLGGNGAATAYVLGRLGVPVRLNTAIGDDAAADLASGWMRSANVEVMCGSNQQTAVNIVKTRSSDGARQSSFFAGSKLQWDVGTDAEDLEWFFTSGYGQVERSDFDTLARVMETVHHRGVRTVFDPGPWFARCVDCASMRKAMPRVEVLSGTLEELATWSTGETPESMIDDYLGLGVRVVVVKMGPEGAQFGCEDARGWVRGKPVPCVHAVGAGDTFNGALLFGLVAGIAPLEEIIQVSVTYAEKAVRSGRGVLGAFPPIDSPDSV